MHGYKQRRIYFIVHHIHKRFDLSCKDNSHFYLSYNENSFKSTKQTERLIGQQTPTNKLQYTRVRTQSLFVPFWLTPTCVLFGFKTTGSQQAAWLMLIHAHREEGQSDRQTEGDTGLQDWPASKPRYGLGQLTQIIYRRRCGDRQSYHTNCISTKKSLLYVNASWLVVSIFSTPTLRQLCVIWLKKEQHILQFNHCFLCMVKWKCQIGHCRNEAHILHSFLDERGFSTQVVNVFWNVLFWFHRYKN